MSRSRFLFVSLTLLTVVVGFMRIRSSNAEDRWAIYPGNGVGAVKLSDEVAAVPKQVYHGEKIEFLPGQEQGKVSQIVVESNNFYIPGKFLRIGRDRLKDVLENYRGGKTMMKGDRLVVRYQAEGVDFEFYGRERDSKIAKIVVYQPQAADADRAIASEP